MKAVVKGFYEKETSTITYVVSCPNTKKAAIIDSVLEFQTNSGKTVPTVMEPIINYVKEHGLKVDWILETHAHADHITCSYHLQKIFGAKVAIGSSITAVQTTFKDIFNTQDLATGN